MRTQKDAEATKHLRNSREIFLKLLEISRALDNKKIAALVSRRDYEELELYLIKSMLK